jgi:Right handed beta helix region
MMRCLPTFALLMAASNAVAGDHRTLVVCPSTAAATVCDFAGGGGIQQAIDAATSGDTILIRAGRYFATGFRDVPFKIQTIRGMAVVDGKDLTLKGEKGAILDGNTGPQTTAIVVRGATVVIRNLELTGFRFAVQEDETYEGHGIFVIDGNVRIDDVAITRFQKMALSGRGQSQIDARGLRIEEGHVGIWLRESAQLRLRDSIVRNNEGSGVAAYATSVAHIENSVFDNNRDDGLYADESAVIFVSNSMLLRNRPIGANAVGNGRIHIDYSAVFGNEAASGSKDGGRVTFGPNVVEGDPGVDSAYQPAADSPLHGKADPDLGGSIGVITTP